MDYENFLSRLPHYVWNASIHISVFLSIAEKNDIPEF